MIQNCELVVSKLLPLLERVKLSPNKNIVNETLTDLKLVKDYMIKVNGHGDDQYIRSLLNQMAQYISIQLNPTQFAQSKELTKIILTFFTQIGEFDDVRILLRDDFSLLKYLPIFLKMTPAEAERGLILSTVEILTRDITVTWKEPHLVDLISHILSSMLKSPENNLSTNLQILINLCSRNHSCILILRGCEDYKSIWKMLGKLVGKDDYVATMVSHLNYLTEIYIPAKSFQSGYDVARTALADALKTHEKGDNFVKLTLSVRQIVETACNKMKTILEDDGIKSANQSADEPENFSSAKHVLLDLVTGFQEELHKFVTENRDKLQDDIKESILLCVETFLLPYTISSSEPSLLRNCLAAAETARRILTSSSKPRLQLQTYKTILRVSDLIFQNKSVTKDKAAEFISLFKDVVRSLKIDGDAPLMGLTLDLYTVSLRLFSLLVVDPQVKDSVKQKLPASIVLAMFNKTSGGNLDHRLKFRHSVFAVELLNVIRQILRPEDLGHYLANPSIISHISNCVRNGEEREISRALLVIVSTGQLSMHYVARNLRQSQELIAGVPSNSIDLSSGANTCERMEVEMTNHYVDNQRVSGDSSAASDLLAWCQIRREAHQQEVSMLNSHILQLNRTNANLNSLLEKQSTFIAKHIAASEQRDLEISTLQHRYEEAARIAQERASELENETATLKQEGAILADANEAMRLEIIGLRKNIADLNGNVAELEEKYANLSADLKLSKDECKSLQKKNHQLNTQLEASQNKVSKLEDDVKLKENELEQLHNTIKQRQVQFDAIQSILGSQFAGKFDLS